VNNEEILDASEAAYLRKYVAELEAELARLRPLAELYPLAWEECKKWRGLIGEHANNREWGCTDINGVWRWVEPADAHDKARAERGAGQ
jgi:hypothetical protein